jgi:cytochrome b561
MALNSPGAPPVYDPRTVGLHWWVALGVVSQWILGRSIDAFPAGPLRVDARSAHILLGLAVLALAAWRIIWRLRFAPQLAPAGPPAIRRLARVMHTALYLLLVATLGLGLALEWVRGDSLFNLFKIPALDPHHREWRRQVGSVHELLANLLLATATAHALAGLIHAAVWRDGVLGRMIPALRRAH